MNRLRDAWLVLTGRASILRLRSPNPGETVVQFDREPMGDVRVSGRMTFSGGTTSPFLDRTEPDHV